MGRPSWMWSPVASGASVRIEIALHRRRTTLVHGNEQRVPRRKLCSCSAMAIALFLAGGGDSSKLIKAGFNAMLTPARARAFYLNGRPSVCKWRIMLLRVSLAFQLTGAASRLCCTAQPARQDQPEPSFTATHFLTMHTLPVYTVVAYTDGRLFTSRLQRSLPFLRCAVAPSQHIALGPAYASAVTSLLQTQRFTSFTHHSPLANSSSRIRFSLTRANSLCETIKATAACIRHAL